MNPTVHGVGRLWAQFDKTAKEHKSRTAIVAGRTDITFSALWSLTEHLASLLVQHGIRAGHMVHLVLPNEPAFFTAFLALNKVSARIGLVSARYRDAEFRALVDRCAPHAFVTTSALASILERSVQVATKIALPLPGDDSALNLLVVASPENSAPASNTRLGDAGNPDLCLVKFTSGSTGAPKGVGLTEANVLAETSNIFETLSIGPTDRILAPVPVSHSYGFDLGVLPVLLGGATVILRTSFIPREILSDLARKDVTILLGVPSMYRILTEMELPNEGIPDLSHLRYLLSCTAPLLPSLIRAFHDRFKAPICQHYGSSETGAISNHIPSKVLDIPGSIGVGLKGVEIRIVDDRGALCEAGEEGEIVIRSKAVASGYVTDETTSGSGRFSRVNDVSEYRTGDLGVLDHEGFLFWKGRKDQVINVGGLKVYPSEVAQVLETCPAVASAHVVAARDQNGEEFVHALVTLSESIREQDILAFCRKRLADYKVPRSITIMDSSPSGESKKARNLLGDIHS